MNAKPTESPIVAPLLKAIAESGLNRLQLANATGVTRQSLIRLERGDAVSVESAEKLAKFLGLELKPTIRKGK